MGMLLEHAHRITVRGMSGTYLFFVTSFSGHCGALKHKEIIKACTWEALHFMLKMCKRPRAEHDYKWAPALLWCSSCVSSVPPWSLPCLVCRRSCPLPPSLSLSRHLCSLLPGPCLPAGHQAITGRSLTTHWVRTTLSFLHQWPEIVGVVTFKGEASHLLAAVTTGASNASHPTSRLQMRPVLALWLPRSRFSYWWSRSPQLLWVGPPWCFLSPFSLEIPSQHIYRHSFWARGQGWAQSYKEGENTVLDLSDFPSTALLSKTMPQGSGGPRRPSPSQMLSGGIGVEVQQRNFPLFVEDFKVREKLGNKWPVNS